MLAKIRKFNEILVDKIKDIFYKVEQEDKMMANRKETIRKLEGQSGSLSLTKKQKIRKTGMKG